MKITIKHNGSEVIIEEDNIKEDQCAKIRFHQQEIKYLIEAAFDNINKGKIDKL